MISLIYQLIKLRLLAITGLNEVDWFTQQTVQDGNSTLYTTPAAYIEFYPQETETLAENVQLIHLRFRVHLVSTAMHDTDRMVDNLVFTHNALLDQIYVQLQNHSAWISGLPGHESKEGTEEDLRIFNNLVRTEIRTDHSLSNLIVSSQDFVGVAYDYTAKKDFQNVLATLDLNIGFPQKEEFPYALINELPFILTSQS